MVASALWQLRSRHPPGQDPNFTDGPLVAKLPGRAKQDSDVGL